MTAALSTVPLQKYSWKCELGALGEFCNSAGLEAFVPKQKAKL